MKAISLTIALLALFAIAFAATSNSEARLERLTADPPKAAKASKAAATPAPSPKVIPKIADHHVSGYAISCPHDCQSLENPCDQQPDHCCCRRGGYHAPEMTEPMQPEYKPTCRFACHLLADPCQDPTHCCCSGSMRFKELALAKAEDKKKAECRYECSTVVCATTPDHCCCDKGTPSGLNGPTLPTSYVAQSCPHDCSALSNPCSQPDHCCCTSYSTPEMKDPVTPEFREACPTSCESLVDPCSMPTSCCCERYKSLRLVQFKEKKIEASKAAVEVTQQKATAKVTKSEEKASCPFVCATISCVENTDHCCCGGKGTPSGITGSKLGEDSCSHDCSTVRDPCSQPDNCCCKGTPSGVGSNPLVDDSCNQCHTLTNPCSNPNHCCCRQLSFSLLEKIQSQMTTTKKEETEEGCPYQCSTLQVSCQAEPAHCCCRSSTVITVHSSASSCPHDCSSLSNPCTEATSCCCSGYTTPEMKDPVTPEFREPCPMQCEALRNPCSLPDSCCCRQHQAYANLLELKEKSKAAKIEAKAAEKETSACPFQCEEMVTICSTDPNHCCCMTRPAVRHATTPQLALPFHETERAITVPHVNSCPFQCHLLSDPCAIENHCCCTQKPDGPVIRHESAPMPALPFHETERKLKEQAEKEAKAAKNRTSTRDVHSSSSSSGSGHSSHASYDCPYLCHELANPCAQPNHCCCRQESDYVAPEITVDLPNCPFKCSILPNPCADPSHCCCNRIFQGPSTLRCGAQCSELTRTPSFCKSQATHCCCQA